VGEIAAASNEQSQGIGQVNCAVAEMDKVVQGNAASAEESASASEEMNAQAEEMKGIVQQLLTMVEGGAAADNRAENADQGISARVNAVPQKGIAGSDGNDRFGGSPGVSPEDVIPMDDGDFEDF